MSYTKAAAPFDPADALAEVCTQHKIDVAGIASQLAPAGQYVTLDTGETVWVGCALHDDPSTSLIDFLAIGFATDGAGPMHKANGQIVSTATWRGVHPERLDAWGIALVRKAAMMLTLGEPQPMVPITVPAADGPTQQALFPISDIDASAGSIRTALRMAAQIGLALTDVL